MGIESYKHQFAKTTLAQWFRDIARDKGGYDKHVKLNPIYWRVNRGTPHYGVWIEYPICLDSQNRIIGDQAWDEKNWDKSEIDPVFDEIGVVLGPCRKENSLLDVRPPTFDETIAMGLTPIVIFDVAIQHKGNLAYGLEVVHRNDISETKLAYLRRIGVETYTIDADWILSRVKRPDELVCKRII